MSIATLHRQPKQFRPAYGVAITGAVIAALVVFLSGCSTAELDKAIEEHKQAQALDEKAAKKANEEIAALKVAREAIAVELQKARDEAKDTTAIEKRLAEAEKEAATKAIIAAELAKSSAEKSGAIAALERQRDAMGDPAAQIGAGAQTISNFLPEPWRSILYGAASVLVTAAGTRQIVRKPLVQKIENQSEAMGTMSVAIAGGVVPMTSEAKTLLNSLQSDGAKAAVRESQQKFAVAMTAAANTPGRVPKAPA